MHRKQFIKITNQLSKILKGTEFEGHVYAVGGSVRDYVMYNEIKDIDLVLDIPNGGIKLAEYLEKQGHLVYPPVIYPTYGTCQFRLKMFPKHELEAVHTRGEQYHDKNSRNPETFFSSIEDDAVRRDLTINALYYDIFTGNIVDPTGFGFDDINNRVIRTSNQDPNVVFNDDPLRILRVVRFAAKYNWTIEKTTFAGMIECKDRLDIISKERIMTEFVSMLNTKHPDYAALLLFKLGLWGYITYGHFNDETEDFIISALRNSVKEQANINIRLAIAFHMFDTTTVREIMHDMKFSNDTIKDVTLLLKNVYSFYHKPTDKEIRMVQLSYDKKSFDDLLTLAKLLKKSRWTKYIKERTDTRKTRMFGYKLPVSGNDIMEMFNIQPGPEIKRILLEMLEYACEKPKATSKQLIDYCLDNGIINKDLLKQKIQ